MPAKSNIMAGIGIYKESGFKRLKCVRCEKVHRVHIRSRFSEGRYLCYKCLRNTTTTCIQCGKEILSKYSVDLCSEECRKKYDKNAGNCTNKDICACGLTINRSFPGRHIFCTEICAKKFQN